jgi:hypothetical protein
MNSEFRKYTFDGWLLPVIRMTEMYSDDVAAQNT